MNAEVTIDGKSVITAITKEIIIDVLSLELEPDEILGSSNLYTLGLDSMNIVDLFLELENRLKVAIDIEDIRPELFEELDSLLEFLSSKNNITA